MGSINCCSESPSHKPKINVLSAKTTQPPKKQNLVFPDSSSTSDSETFKFYENNIPNNEKMDQLLNFMNQRQFQVSSIQKISEYSESFSQHLTFRKYLEKLQKEISPSIEEMEHKSPDTTTFMGTKTKIDMKLLMEHSSKCPICYQLFQNFKNMEPQQSVEAPLESDENRISLRDSLLEFEKCEKAKRCAECKCQVLNNQQEAQKAMRKYPNTNKYQSKKLRFRKTSLFQPEIKQERQSQQSF